MNSWPNLVPQQEPHGRGCPPRFCGSVADWLDSSYAEAHPHHSLDQGSFSHSPSGADFV